MKIACLVSILIVCVVTVHALPSAATSGLQSQQARSESSSDGLAPLSATTSIPPRTAAKRIRRTERSLISEQIVGTLLVQIVSTAKRHQPHLAVLQSTQ
jgi:hypothetical protein